MKRIPLQQFLGDQQGSILLLVGLSLIFLFGIAGAGYDLGHQQLVRQKLQQATDASALAAATLPLGATPAQRQTVALRYFNLNYPASYLGVARPTPIVIVGASDVLVNVASPVTIQTNFVSNFGITTLTASGKGTDVQIAASGASDYDVVMVVDETYSTIAAVGGSDSSIRMTDMQAALTAMANTIVPVGNTNPNVRMGFMGYSSHITNKWGLSNQNSDALTAISKLRPTCNNYDHVGMAAGLNMLLGGQGAPNGQVTSYPFIGGYDCAVDTNTTAPNPRTARTATSDANGISPVKNVVFLTDGDIMTDPAPCADPNDPHGGADCYADPAFRNYPEFLASCDNIKAVAGSHIFVINFASPPATALAAMQNCASTNALTGLPDFYYATDLASLMSILQNITSTIQKQRILQ